MPPTWSCVTLTTDPPPNPSCFSSQVGVTMSTFYPENYCDVAHDYTSICCSKNTQKINQCKAKTIFAKQVKFASDREHHSTSLGDKRLCWIDPMCADQTHVLDPLFQASLPLFPFRLPLLASLRPSPTYSHSPKWEALDVSQTILPKCSLQQLHLGPWKKCTFHIQSFIKCITVY